MHTHRLVVLAILLICMSGFGKVQAATKAPIFTEVRPNGAWSVVEDTDGDGCYDHVQGRNCAGSTVNETYSDNNCMIVPHDKGPFTGVVSAGNFNSVSTSWEITLYRNSSVKGFMRLADGVVSTEWVPQSIVEQPAGTFTNDAMLADPLVNQGTATKHLQSVENGLTVTSSTPSTKMSDVELADVHAKMAHLLTDTKEQQGLSITANGTANGIPSSFTVQAIRSGAARIDLVNLASAERTTLTTTSLLTGANQIPLSLSALPSGAYLILISQDGTMAMTSITVVH